MTLVNIVRAASAALFLSTAQARLATQEESAEAFNKRMNVYAEGVENDVIEVSNAIIKNLKNKKLNTYIKVKLSEGDEIKANEGQSVPKDSEIIYGLSMPLKDNAVTFEIHRIPAEKSPSIVLEVSTSEGKIISRFEDLARYGSVDRGYSFVERMLGMSSVDEFDLHTMIRKDGLLNAEIPLSRQQIELIEKTYGTCVRKVRDYIREKK